MAADIADYIGLEEVSFYGGLKIPRPDHAVDGLEGYVEDTCGFSG
jgi:hypothetical protein